MLWELAVVIVIPIGVVISSVNGGVSTARWIVQPESAGMVLRCTLVSSSSLSPSSSARRGGRDFLLIYYGRLQYCSEKGELYSCSIFC